MMNEKKKRMIETAIDLFAHKGFHAVSVKEITDNSDVSKGTFYIYFDSKEDLLLSIYKYYYQLMMERIDQVRARNAGPKDSLASQIQVYFETLIDNKSFILMLLREQVSIGKKVEETIHEIKNQQMEWSRSNLTAIYGSDIQPYIMDGVIILQGLIQIYSKWCVIGDHHEMDYTRLSRFIVERLDDCVQGMIRSGEPPLIPDLDLTNSLTEILNKMGKKLTEMDLQPDEKKDLTEALAILKQELAKERPNPILVQGILDQFKSLKPLKEEYGSLTKHAAIQAISNQRSDQS